MKSELTSGHLLGSTTKNLRVVVREMPADLETPVSAYLKLKDHGARVLLESVENGITLGRYSFIGIRPGSKISITPKATVVENGEGVHQFPHIVSGHPFDGLKRVLAGFNIEGASRLPHLLGGAIGYVSYDFVRFMEKIPSKATDTEELPLALFYLIDTLLVFDHVQRRLRILTLCEDSDVHQSSDRVDEIVSILRRPLSVAAGAISKSSEESLESNMTQAAFCEAVLNIQEEIRAGEVYQLVFSQRQQGRTDAETFMIYRALRMLNPSPYMFYLDFDDLKLIGSSPEALVKLDNGVATVRPIAGTRPRGKDEDEDKYLSRDLLNDTKERAEHVMLVDLGRNDLGRCCDYGTVRVTDYMRLEMYSHVMHMTSNVVGKLKKGMDQFDLFKAVFPAGTVTGAPKVRAMQLIEDLESIRRGPYAGAVGYFSLSGDMDWCITIRTIIMKGQRYILQAGAGIVADSRPEKEYEETCHKLAALKKAISVAEEGLK